MDTNKIAYIIAATETKDQLIDALANAYEADDSLCHYKMRCQHSEHDFDRIHFKRIAESGHAA